MLVFDLLKVDCIKVCTSKPLTRSFKRVSAVEVE